MGICGKNVEEIFHKASEIGDTEKRAQYLEKACSGDRELRSELEFLLESDDEAGDFMETPPPELASVVGRPVLSEGPGTVIGSYKLLEVIGEGGMAVVYMAEQQHPIQRKVALKLVKLGMDTKQVIARFEAERQALALMDHPHIARVFDAGTTESGRPYFVMELVKGMSITEFCDKKRLNTQDRLNLFVCVCQAVHHAHQKGVIHRDIKPSNIMVTLHDGRPMPKVIDFGIAKATNRRLTEKTLFTHYAQIIGTPEYMSPEQAEMTDLDVDTRSDVYSLGVLLYELLTGRPPFEVAYLRSKGYAEIQRIIREEEPTRPSTRISTLGEALLDIADVRGTTPDALRRLVRADLDWIAMKALEKDRARRYDSARELGADIERHLKHQPVLAGPPGIRYRSKKFLQRHRTLALTTVAVALALVLGAALTSYLFEIQAGKAEQLHTVFRLYAAGRYQDALKEIQDSSLHPAKDDKLRLLHAQLLYKMGRRSEAETRLLALADGPAQIAAPAHYLLSQIYQSTDAQKALAHRKQAEQLPPSTADACALQALTAATPQEALQWLDRALDLDPSHYAAREARALVYYGMHDYLDMQQDAEVIVALREQYYLGYALRALAQRELNKLDTALSDYNRALELCDVETELPVLLDQRQETYWRLGEYEAALQDARQCVALAPYSSEYQASLIKLLFKLHQYEQAKQAYSQPDGTDRWTWITVMSRYISDAISAGEAPEIPEDVLETWPPSGLPPGLLLSTIADLCRCLEARATRLVQGSFDTSTWSPDGKQLAYTRSEFFRWDDKALQAAGLTGSIERKGIEILDLDTKRTHTLSTFGGRPAWSSDGRFIAFVHALDYVYRGVEEIWLVPAQGGAPRRLVAGSCPCWTNHPTRLYFVSGTDDMLCCIDVNDPSASPVPVVPCPRWWQMAVSPDERFLAYVVAGDLTIVELATGKKVVNWTVPGVSRYSCVRWSPDGKEISLGIGWILRWPSGLWIFDVEHNQGRHVLDPMALSCNWSPDRSRLAVDLGFPMNEIWLAETDPNLSTWEALGGGQTRAHYIQRHWQRDLQSYQQGGAFNTKVFLRNTSAIALNQYEWGEYEDALWTAQQILEVTEVKGTLSEVKALASMAMSLVHLNRYEEARQALRQLRRICARGETTDESYLYEAEKRLAARDKTLHSIWQAIQDGHSHEALDLLETHGKDLSTPMQAKAIQSARSALARKYYLNAQAARHQGHVDLTATHYKDALRADPNHVPSLRGLAWLLATCEDKNLRDGKEAQSLARRACALTAYQEHTCLAGLAAAQAACGDFPAAVKWQQQALQHLPEGQSSHELLTQLKRYESGQSLPADSDPALVAWWPFTDADMKRQYAQDASDLGLHGVYKGDAQVVADPQRGHVLRLDGRSDWVECAHHPRFNFVDEITVSLWVKVKTFSLAHQALIIKGHTWSFCPLPFGNMVGFECVEVDVRSNPWGILVGRQDLADGRWHHLAAVYDSTTVYQYIDGQLDASAPARGKLKLDDGPLYLGKCGLSAGKAHQRLIDDVRIYSRALSVKEIRALYDGRELHSYGN